MTWETTAGIPIHQAILMLGIFIYVMPYLWMGLALWVAQHRVDAGGGR